MDILNIDSAQLRKAADLKERIEALQRELNELLGGQAKPETAAATTGKRPISAAGRARIAAAAKARWAKFRAAAPPKPAAAPKRHFSPAARARLAAIAKARWAKAKREGRASL